MWGRDELGTGEMWNSNAVVAWLLARAGLPVDDITPPPGGRAPGWQAGLITARRQQQDDLQQQVEVVGGHLRLAKDRGQRPLRERSSMQGDNDREMPLMTSQLAVTALDAGLDKTGSFQRPDDLSRSRDGRKLGHPGMRTSTNASSGFASISGTGLSSK